MTTHSETATVGTPGMWAPGPGHAYPATAPGVPLSAFAFAFAVGFLGLVKTGILSSAANDMFIAVAFGIGAVGLLVGGLWEFRGGELFGGTFGVGYAGFLFSTGLILKFFAAAVIASAGPIAFGDAFAAISLAALAPFALAFVVLILLAIAGLGGTASWVSAVTRIGGWVAIADGFAAGYLASALLLNTTIGREVLPMWPSRLREQ
jgi:succinate-acetate transporter protein